MTSSGSQLSILTVTSRLYVCDSESLGDSCWKVTPIRCWLNLVPLHSASLFYPKFAHYIHVHKLSPLCKRMTGKGRHTYMYACRSLPTTPYCHCTCSLLLGSCFFFPSSCFLFFLHMTSAESALLSAGLLSLLLAWSVGLHVYTYYVCRKSYTIPLVFLINRSTCTYTWINL